MLEDAEPDALIVLGNPENFAQTLRFLRCQPVSKSFGSDILIPKLCALNAWLRCQPELLGILHAEQPFWLCRNLRTAAECAWQTACCAKYPKLREQLGTLFEYELDKLRIWLERCVNTMDRLLTMLRYRHSLLMINFENEEKWSTPLVRYQAHFAVPFCLATEMLQTFLQDQVHLYNCMRNKATFTKLRKPLTAEQQALLVAGLPPFRPTAVDETEATFLQYWHLLQKRHAVVARLANMLDTAWIADSRALTTSAHLKHWLSENGAEEYSDPSARMRLSALFRRMLGEHFNIAYKAERPLQCCIVAQRESQIAEFVKTKRDHSPQRKNKLPL